MHVIEQFTQSKTGNDNLNEDTIVITPDYVGIFDGATSFTGLQINGMPNGRFASTTAHDIVKTMPANFTAKEAVEYLTKEFRKARDKAAAAMGIEFKTPDSYPASAMLLYSRTRKEVWRIADSPFMADGVLNDDPIKPIEGLTKFRQLVIKAALANGATEKELRDNDPVADTWRKHIPPMQIFLNTETPYSYGMITGETIPESLIHVYPVPDAKELVLASDGYIKLFNTLAETEKVHQDIIKKDPLLVGEHAQVKGVKTGWVSFDDRTYLRFKP